MEQTPQLLFGTGGNPLSSKGKSTVQGIQRLGELGLDAMELEYVHGTFPGEKTALAIAGEARARNIRLSAHGPYYINLNAIEPEKRAASRKRIYNTARFGLMSGAETVTFHAGFFLNMPPSTVYEIIRDELAGVMKNLADDGISIDVRPELTGKPTQFGSVEELLQISHDIPGVYPCIDWSHFHARTGAGNTEAEFEEVLDGMAGTLGEGILTRMHMHVSGIEFTARGERRHVGLDESDFDFRALLRVLKRRGVGGFLICESPLLEDDALLMKRYYESLPSTSNKAAG